MENDLKTRDEIINDLQSPFKSALNTGGIDDDFLIKQLKREFENEEPKTIKVRGHIDSRKLPKNYKVIARPLKNEDGDTVIEHKVHQIGISQKARIDVHKLRGDYPAEKHDLRGNFNVSPEITPEDRVMLTNVSNKVVDAIINKHRRDITGS